MAKKKKEKSTFRIYAEYLPFCLLYGVIHILPLKTGYALSTFLFRLLYLIDRRHRVRTVQHLMHAGMFTDKAEASRFARKTYLEFAKLLVEVVKMKQLYSKDKIFVTGSQETIDYVTPAPGKESGEQVIIITAHYGNWEVAGTAFSEQANRPMTSFMRSFGNPLIGRMILAHRAGKLHELVDKTEGIRPILRARYRPARVTSGNFPPEIAWNGCAISSGTSYPRSRSSRRVDGTGTTASNRTPGSARRTVCAISCPKKIADPFAPANFIR